MFAAALLHKSLAEHDSVTVSVLQQCVFCPGLHKGYSWAECREFLLQEPGKLPGKLQTQNMDINMRFSCEVCGSDDRLVRVSPSFLFSCWKTYGRYDNFSQT